MATLLGPRIAAAPCQTISEVRRLLSVAVAALLGSVLLGCEPECKLRQVQALPVGDEKSIVCYVSLEWEGTQPWFYEVLDGERVLVPVTAFAFWIPRPGLPVPLLDVLRSRDGAVVAVTEKCAPESILILHDFQSGCSWPKDEEDKVHAAMDLLRDANPGLDFVLTTRFFGAPRKK